MTERELEQLRRMRATVHKQGKNLEVLNLDLSKWNSTFCHTLVYYYGKSIDEMFGFSNLFTNNHYWFLTYNVFSNSRLFPPDYDITTKYPIPGKYYYNNHLGGFEGIRQKFWTLITICIIRLTSDELSLKINIICQGDNQVVLIKYKPNQIKRQSEVRNLFLSTLDYNFGQVNIKLKLEETWYSKRLFEYCKVRYLEDISISQGTKKAARLIHS